ncbi:hypothetical protein M9H77_35723 [Catharanthus roseus]|uniref:Uncharacterized protein n=1 Tax=Catharanthus roseus TaxID=4058 RepID=A0ACB9ZRP9_CATRO|nr:hypothetical protein M9H77_35723 [Catharanthus roseus]
MVGEQPIGPRRSLALGLDDLTLSPLARTRYSSPSSTSTTTSSATPVSLGIRLSMEDIDEGFEEDIEREHNAEGRGSSGSDLEVVGMTLEEDHSRKLGIIQGDGIAVGNGCIELALFAEQYNENLVKGFYANLAEEFGNPESPAYGQAYVSEHVIDFSPTNIAHYLSCPRYNDIEGTSLEEEIDFDEVTKALTSDVGAV